MLYITHMIRLFMDIISRQLNIITWLARTALHVACKSGTNVKKYQAAFSWVT